MISPILNLLSRVRKPRSAAVVRSVAGLPVSAANRRGTVLVLVIGALALISVITLIYATIGQGDRRLAASTRIQADIQTTGTAVADYISLTISDAAFALMADGEYSTASTRRNPLLVRPAADYPWTDSYRLSVMPSTQTPAIADRRFDRTGSYDTLWAGTTNVDPRIPTSPYLASTQPIALTPPTPGTAPNIMAGHDWLHISDVAPDGRFVNLWNLAPVVNVGGNLRRVSCFRSYSAWDPTGGLPPQPGPDPANASITASYMSFGLSLFDPVTGFPTQNLDFGGPADPNIPAHWSCRQAYMYRPAAGPMYFPPAAPNDPQTGLSPNKPGSMWYPQYQYCDADGDGLFDSRWIELVDAHDPNNPVSFLPKDDRYRWFIATRVMDLSSLVNVNTATDFGAPTAAPGTTPATLFGAYPADVDLRRVLTMDDAYRLYTGTPGGQGYAGLEQPLTPGPDNYAGYDQATARRVGDRGYRALRLALNSASESVQPASFNLGAAVPLWRDERYTYYTGFGGQSEAGYGLTGTTATFGHSARITAADLKELLTYWMANNASSTSRLEAIVDGRYNTANGGTNLTAILGALRSNRGSTLERGGIDNFENNGQGDGKADQDAMIRSVFDVRHYITPLSWSRPLRSTIIPQASSITGLSAKSVLDKDVDLKVDVARGLAAATTVTVQNQDPSVIFKGYASALLPYAWVRTATPPTASAWDRNSRFATLNFGANAELALRIAAHLTANLIDSYDKDNAPHPYTLLIDESKRPQVTADPTRVFPWWNEPGNAAANTFPNRLDFGPANLARTTGGIPGPDPAPEAQLGAINIYGTEAQPFITHAMSFFIYTDTPFTATDPGDEENQGETIPPFTHPITIDGSLSSPDNLGQVIAFQLTNPFSVDIKLTDEAGSGNEDPIADNQFSDYYVQFGGDMANGGHIYKLAWYHEASGGELTAVVLHPGETRTFYCLNDTKAALGVKWRNAEPALAADELDKFLENQLSTTPAPGVTYPASERRTSDGRIKPIQIRQMASPSGVTQPTAGRNLFDGAAASNKHVMLWRVLHSTNDPAGSGNPNDRRNDMLVDHLRDPGPVGAPAGSTLDRRLPSSNQPIAGTQAGPDGIADNTGFSIVMWGSLKRRNDPGIPGGNPPLGAIPAYCVEAKWGTGSLGLTNVSSMDAATPASLNSGDFSDPTRLYSAKKLKTMALKLDVETDPPGPPFTLTGVIKKTITQMPQDWAPAAGNAMPPNLDTPARNYETLYPLIHLNNNKFEGEVNPGVSPKISTLRVADLLLPMGLGTMCDPAIGNGPTDPNAWMTLSEALGLALNYSNPPPIGPAGFGLYNKVGDSVAGVLDRGNLALDRGAPFEDMNTNKTYEGPGSATTGLDRIRWPGIPLSLNILNVFTVNEPQFGGLTQGQPGLININTAPQAVLNTIPLLAPTTEPDPITNAPNGIWNHWKTIVGVTAGTTSVPEAPSAIGANDGTDLASGILAYRERLPAIDRDYHEIRFTDIIAGATPFDNLKRDGRTQTNKIPALRETPGFATPGEILTMIDRTGAANTPGTTRITVRGDQIDGLAHDNLPSGAVGMNTTLYKDSTGTLRIDAVPDDYSEKLLVAQTALGSITVRSDLFAVWFVIQGYQKSDTEGLSLNDPLKPSVSKRFLMVVDRSNVTHKGEKPRILFLTELPM